MSKLLLRHDERQSDEILGRNAVLARKRMIPVQDQPPVLPDRKLQCVKPRHICLTDKYAEIQQAAVKLLGNIVLVTVL